MRVQGAKPPEALKSLQSTLPEVVKNPLSKGIFSIYCILNSQKKSLKFRTKSKHFQTNVGRLHSFIKMIKFYQDCGNHFKMIYTVAYILCINHIAASTSVFCLILTLVGQGTYSTQNRKLYMNIICRQNIHTCIIYLATLLVILTGLAG